MRTDVCQNTRCNRPFENEQIGRPKRYCCAACRVQAHRDAKRTDGTRRTRYAKIDIDHFERLIVDVWLQSGPSAATMLEYAQLRCIPVNYLWIEREVDRRRDQESIADQQYSAFLSWVDAGR